VVDAGVTVTGDPLIAPGFQVYVEAPVPVRVEVLPEQMVGLLAVAVTVGEGLTVISCVVVEEQPDVPVTVYVVVVAGETVTEVPVSAPGFHVYVVAPEAVIVVEVPEQIVALDAVTVTVGVGLTVTVTVCVEVQPFAAVPVMVYVVVDAGETVTVAPDNGPGSQL
jgi:hypothetical protein